jgi:hypothetical protein
MKRPISRDLAKHLVVTATMGLAVIATWVVTSAAQPPAGVRAVDGCDTGSSVAGAQVRCRSAARAG